MSNQYVERLHRIALAANKAWTTAAEKRFNIGRMSPTDFMHGEDALYWQAATENNAAYVSCGSAYHQPIALVEDDAEEKLKGHTLPNCVRRMEQRDPRDRWDTELISYKDDVCLWQRGSLVWETEGFDHLTGGRKLLRIISN